MRAVVGVVQGEQRPPLGRPLTQGPRPGVVGRVAFRRPEVRVRGVGFDEDSRPHTLEQRVRLAAIRGGQRDEGVGPRGPAADGGGVKARDRFALSFGAHATRNKG